MAKLRRRPHRIERLRGLRYHHKLIFSVLIFVGVLALVVLIAKDRRFADNVAALATPRYPARGPSP